MRGYFRRFLRFARVSTTWLLVTSMLLYGPVPAFAATPSAAPDGNWSLTQEMLLTGTVNDTNPCTAAAAVSGCRAVVGTYGDKAKGLYAGAAFIWERNGETWIQKAKLLASDGGASDYFGYSVAVSGDTAVVGAYRDDDKGTDAGAAYVFTRNGDGTWTQKAKLLASDGGAFDYFGCSVAVSGDIAAVGASNDDDKGTNAGAAYAFLQDANGTWTQQTKLLASDGGGSDYLGCSVAVSGRTVVAGAYGDDDEGSDAGAAYVFTGDGFNWTQKR
ncbi:MAG: FG-GAP repeat protein, partial [Coriobacteriia bacterium]|nr:FG-GAP repeat protein [Coriobacteriia bacterium]